MCFWWDLGFGAYRATVGFRGLGFRQITVATCDVGRCLGLRFRV